MKRILSFILALAMFASCATVAMAADFEFEFALLDSEQENEVTEVNVGEQVYLIISSSTKTDVYGIELNFDTTAFEIATIEDDGEVYPAVFGEHNDAVVFNPEGQENVISVGGMRSGLKKAVEAQVGLIAKKAGTYEISFKGQRDKDMPDGAASTAANSLTLTVKGGEPEVVVETAEGVAVYGPIDVTNNDGSKYTINSALAFVSWVDNTKATPVKTVITRADAEGKELPINAEHYVAFGEKTYFVAAVSSIKEASIGKTFTATAYAKLLADGSEVAGVPATGVYTAPVAAE